MMFSTAGCTWAHEVSGVSGVGGAADGWVCWAANTPGSSARIPMVISRFLLFITSSAFCPARLRTFPGRCRCVQAIAGQKTLKLQCRLPHVVQALEILVGHLKERPLCDEHLR